VLGARIRQLGMRTDMVQLGVCMLWVGLLCLGFQCSLGMCVWEKM
jgi:hypothetical protein